MLELIPLTILAELLARLFREGGPEVVGMVTDFLRGKRAELFPLMPKLYEEIDREVAEGDLDSQSDLDVRLFDAVGHIAAGQPDQKSQ